MESELIMGHRHHGEVCEDGWIIFNYNSAQGNSSVSAAGHRRRLASAWSRRVFDGSAGPSEIVMDRYEETKRLLSSESTNDTPTTHGTSAVHLSVHIWRYSGSFFVRLAHGSAPIKLVPPFSFVGNEDDDITVNICNVGGKDGELPETVFVGLLGAEVGSSPTLCSSP